jgi:SAM-dependent MidA family methyltransferase
MINPQLNRKEGEVLSAKQDCQPIIRFIRDRISAHPLKAIPFRDYMEICLYHETYGYYCRDEGKVGKEGDFYTSANIGNIMGTIVGRSMARAAEANGWSSGPLRIVEWGGGTGRMAGQILDAIAEASPSIYSRLEYVMAERSPFHRKLQQEELKRHANVRHILPEEWGRERIGEPVIVFSNELLDAFPVHRLMRKDGILHEIYVGWNEETESFEEKRVPLRGGPVSDWIETQGIRLLEGQIIEANLEAGDWIKSIGEAIQEGMLMTVDYGDVADELYAPHRMAGTLMCYRKHQAASDPYAYPGEQDMTAHVDFTACIRAGCEAGFDEWSLRTQKQFLIEEGVLELLVAHDGSDPFSASARRNRAIRQLLLSDQMSELFKVLVQTKKR